MTFCFGAARNAVRLALPHKTPLAFPIVFLAALGACSRRDSSSSSSPAPSSSVISLGVAFDACTDRPFCEKRCDAGDSDECRRLGVALQLGQGGPKDEARAVGLFEKACDLKNAMACVSAGQMNEFEHGVKKDVAKAAAFYKIACAGGYAPGCYNFAIMLENGRGIPKDLWGAADYFDMACRAGAKLACARAGELRESAPIVVDAGLFVPIDAGDDSR